MPGTHPSLLKYLAIIITMPNPPTPALQDGNTLTLYEVTSATEFDRTKANFINTIETGHPLSHVVYDTV